MPIENLNVMPMFRLTALHNHMRIVFEQMSSWTPLTMYLGMKTAFETKYIKASMFGLLVQLLTGLPIQQRIGYLALLPK